LFPDFAPQILIWSLATRTLYLIAVPLEIQKVRKAKMLWLGMSVRLAQNGFYPTLVIAKWQ
jgi:hypothetical protein